MKSIIFNIIVLSAIILIFYVVHTVLSYIGDAQYLKMEINRSFSQREINYWKRELKVRRISMIPFVSRKRVRRWIKKRSGEGEHNTKT